MARTILLVDDHAIVRKTLREWLQLLFPDYRLLEADNGEQAVQLALAEQPDAIVMDINLPVITGIEATRRIKTICPHIGVIILTIYEDEAYRRDAFNAGASAFISKQRMQPALSAVLTELLPAGPQTLPEKCRGERKVL